MSNLVKRTLSGIVYISVVIASVLLSQTVFSVCFGIMALWAIWEFCHLLGLDSWLKAEAMLCGAFLYCIYALPCLSVWFQIMYGVVLMGSLISELFHKQDNPMHNWGFLLCTQVMLALPFAIANKVLTFGSWEVGRYILLALFVCIWLNDTGAYCVGSLLGKHKMFPRVSPAKSWEGLVGGFIASLAAGYVFSFFVTEYTWWQWLLIAFTTSLFGTFGDLMESIFKRTLGVKDSGKFMPGHGGVLDRFDSILLCTPAVYLLLLLMEQLA